MEFARELEIQGKGIMEAALEACRLRLRPIVMTSIAFIAGTIPLILVTGQGQKCAASPGSPSSRDAGRDAVWSVPDAGLYVTLRKFVTRGKAEREVLPA